jgi:hypothetical protein
MFKTLLALLVASGLMAGLQAADEPVAILLGSRAARLHASANDTSPPHVIRTGKEVLKWVLPGDLPKGVYRVEMVVRTGNTDANPLNVVSYYRLWTEAMGAEDALGFRGKSGSPPRRTPGQWPHHVGVIEGLRAMSLTGGETLFATARSSWAEVNEIRILPAREEDSLSFSLSTPRQWQLFRRGESMVVGVRMDSFLGESISLPATVQLFDPYGEVAIQQAITLQAAPNAATEQVVSFEATRNGLHIARLETTWHGHAYSAELALPVVSVPVATELSVDSPFGVHSAGLTEMYQTGFKWIRLWDTGDTWNQHEREKKGAFDFSKTSAKVDRFREQGFEVLAVLAYTPTWATTRPDEPHYTGAGAPYPPKNMQDWRDYCREFMTRFRGRIRHFEVWNEPNAGFFKGTADEYVDLLRVAYEVSREVGPEIRIVGGSGTGDFLRWTEDILSRDAGKYMDILSFHAYTTPSSPEEANLEGRLRSLHELATKHGVPDIPIWNTEVGYWNERRTGVRPATAEEILARAPENLAPNWQTGWPYRPIPEDDSAAFTVRHYYLNVAGGVERLFWYSSVTSNFPLLCRDSSPRLAALAVASAAEQLAGFQYWRRVDLGLSRLHLHLWRNGEAVKGILWYADRGTKGVVFPTADDARVLDIWGNPVALASGQGLTIEAGRDPLTIVAPAVLLEAAKVDATELVLPVTDSFVVAEVNPERPVKNHTSPNHHGQRKVYGLPDKGDALGWEIRGIRPSYYEVLLEARTGSTGKPYGVLGTYQLTQQRGEHKEVLELIPVTDDELKPKPVGTPEGGDRLYGFARVAGSVWLEPGDRLVVTNQGGFGFVGQLVLRETGKAQRLYPLPTLAGVPAIDGDVGDLAGLKPWQANRRRQVVIGVADPFASTNENDAWRGPEDLSAEFVAARVPGGLYVAVRVTDPGALHPAAKGAWGGDCLELFLDLRPEEEVGLDAVGAGTYQIFLRAPATGKTAKPEGRVPEGIQAVGTTTDKGWQAEFLVPVDWSGRKVLGIDLALDDDDTGQGRKTQLVWHGDGDNFQNPANYGRFQLATDEE